MIKPFQAAFIALCCRFIQPPKTQPCPFVQIFDLGIK